MGGSLPGAGDSPPSVPQHPRRFVVVAVLEDAGLFALTAGWVVTRSWGWAVASAVMLGSSMAYQSMALPAWRAGRQPAQLHGPLLLWGVVTTVAAFWLLPIAAVLQWDPPWHGLAGALLLALEVGLLVWGVVEAKGQQSDAVEPGPGAGGSVSAAGRAMAWLRPALGFALGLLLAGWISHGSWGWALATGIAIVLTFNRTGFLLLVLGMAVQAASAIAAVLTWTPRWQGIVGIAVLILELASVPLATRHGRDLRVQRVTDLQQKLRHDAEQGEQPALVPPRRSGRSSRRPRMIRTPFPPACLPIPQPTPTDSSMRRQRSACRRPARLLPNRGPCRSVTGSSRWPGTPTGCVWRPGPAIGSGCGLGPAAVGWEQQIGGRFAPVASVAFSPDGSRLVAPGVDCTARVFDTSTGQPRMVVAHDAAVGGVAFSPDGTLVATASADKTARTWDTDTGQQLLQVTHEAAVGGVAFSPDGTLVATASADKTARTWDTDTGQQQLQMTHEAAVAGVAFSPDGTLLATASADKTARTWDTDTGQQLLQFIPPDRATAVAFSPDGSRVATGCLDGSARVWDAATGRQLRQVIHAGHVLGVSFNPDGTHLATGAGTTAQIWDVAERGGVLTRHMWP